MASHFLLWVVLCSLVCMNYGEIRTEPGCSADKDQCEFSLSISSYWTMMYFIDYGIMYPVVIGDNGTYFAKSKSCDELYPLNDTEASMVILGDGRQKPVLLFNKQLPGPALVVYEGQELIVRVTNNLSGYVTTVHWHGLTMRGTPHMDGVSDVSQYPIPPRQTFTYRFFADTVGTHWYHTHLGTQRTMGAYGPLIVLPRPQQVPEVAPYADDFIMAVSDWMHENSGAISLRMMHDSLVYAYGDDNDTCYTMTQGVDGLEVGVAPFVSGIVNGKGRYYPENSRDKAKDPHIPLERFTVQKRPTSRVRFRMIAASMIFAFKVSIDQHDLHVIASDGCDVDPLTVQYLIIHPGERFDFWIEPSDPANIGRYWIRLTTLEYKQGGKLYPAGRTAAILQYEQASDKTKGKRAVSDPESEATTCSKDKPCKVLNCPMKHYPESFHSECVSLDQLRATDKKPIIHPEEKEDLVEIFLNYHFSGINTVEMFKPTINGKVFLPPDKPLQLQSPHAPAHSIACNETECDEDICFCTYQIDIPLNKVVQLVLFTSMPELSSFITGSHHPVHIHGHHMEVLKVAYPSYDPDTGLYAAQNADIKCTVNSMCNEATWSNSSWKGGNVPGIIEEGAPRKDTVLVPGGGYVVARFRSDNPGFWYMHCHMEIHNQLGMAMVIKVGELEDMPTVTPDAVEVDRRTKSSRVDTVKSKNQGPSHMEDIEPIKLLKASPALQSTKPVTVSEIGAVQANLTTELQCQEEINHYLVAILIFAITSVFLLILFVWLIHSMRRPYDYKVQPNTSCGLVGSKESERLIM